MTPPRMRPKGSDTERLRQLLIEGPALERRSIPQFARRLGVKPSAVRILLALDKDEPRSLPTLREQLTLGESTVSEGLGALVHKGLANDRSLQSATTGRWTRVASRTTRGERRMQQFLDDTAAEERARANRKRSGTRRRPPGA
jgi:DNA-binding MarR family transcriptional regulator